MSHFQRVEETKEVRNCLMGCDVLFQLYSKDNEAAFEGNVIHRHMWKDHSYVTVHAIGRVVGTR